MNPTRRDFLRLGASAALLSPLEALASTAGQPERSWAYTSTTRAEETEFGPPGYGKSIYFGIHEPGKHDHWIPLWQHERLHDDKWIYVVPKACGKERLGRLDTVVMNVSGWGCSPDFAGYVGWVFTGPLAVRIFQRLAGSARLVRVGGSKWVFDVDKLHFNSEAGGGPMAALYLKLKPLGHQST